MNHNLSRRLCGLFEKSFPKKCSNCGKEYATLEDYFCKTTSLGNLNNPFHFSDEDNRPFVMISRNCRCGSTLLEVFDDRRDHTEKGKKIREEFGELLGLLVASGLKEETARAELKKVMNGEESAILERALSSKKG